MVLFLEHRQTLNCDLRPLTISDDHVTLCVTIPLTKDLRQYFMELFQVDIMLITTMTRYVIGVLGQNSLYIWPINLKLCFNYDKILVCYIATTTRYSIDLLGLNILCMFFNQFELFFSEQGYTPICWRHTDGTDSWKRG